MTENTLKLEVGKRYVRRDGGVTAPLEPNGSCDAPVWDPAHCVSYTSTGRWHIGYSGNAEPLDIVAEYVEQTPATPEPEETAPAPQKINDGGAAFPVFAAKPTPGGGVHYDLSGGMSLRDWFAGMALMGATASPALLEILTKTTIAEGGHFDRLAAATYRQADAMLKAREARS